MHIQTHYAIQKAAQHHEDVTPCLPDLQCENKVNLWTERLETELSFSDKVPQTLSDLALFGGFFSLFCF